MNKIKNEIIKSKKNIMIISSLIILSAIFFPLENGISANATITPEGRPFLITDPFGSSIIDVLVKEGEFVKKDQSLILIDNSLQKTNLEYAKMSYLSMLVEEDRLLSEINDKNKIVYREELNEYDEVLKDLKLAQEKLFQKRKMAIDALMKYEFNNKKSLEEQEQGLKKSAEQKQVQIVTTDKEIEKLTELANEGWIPKNKLNETIRLNAEIKSNQIQILTNAAKLKTDSIGSSFKIEQIKEERLKEIIKRITELKAEISVAKEKYITAKNDFYKSLIKSPVDGSVANISWVSLGTKVTPGYKIMEIIPKNKDLILEAKINNKDISSITIGQKVVAHINAFNKDLPFKEFNGEVSEISANAINDEKNLTSTYLVKIKFNFNENDKEVNGKLISGMQSDVFIITGKGSLFNNWIYPLTRRIFEGARN